VKTTDEQGQRMRRDWNKEHLAPKIGIGGVFVAVFVVIAADGLKLEPRAFFETLRDWQDLVGGALSLLAAIFAGNFVLSQIQQVDGIEAERRQRAAVSARAVMPLSLGVLASHAHNAGVTALGLIGNTPRPRRPKTGFPPFPPPPAGVIPDLQAFVLAGPVDIGDEIAKAISDLQVLHAQAEGVWARLQEPGRLTGVQRKDLEELVARAAAIYARVSNLFPYARREVEGFGPISEKDVENALQLMYAFPDVYPDIARRAVRLALEA
jgi:hypothetical protein